MQAISAAAPALAPLATRPLFPVAATCAYLNHAAVSPLATPTRRAMDELLAANCGPAVRDWRARFARLEQIRATLARLVGAAPCEIAFTKNTSEALSIVANGLDWRPGDRVVTFECEFPANLYPWLALRPRGVKVELLPEAALLDLDRLRRACRSARLLSLSFVQYLSGLRADLAAIGAICRESGTLLVVDGIQGLGAFPIDVKRCGIHALANGSQKWLMAPEGAGFLFLDQAVLGQFQPREVGWCSVADWENFDGAAQPARDGSDLVWQPGAPRFECGMPNSLGLYGLGASVELLLSVGLDAIADHVLALGDHLTVALRSRGYEVLRPSEAPERRSAINSFRPKRQSPAQLVAQLESAGVICTYRGEYVRIAPHLYNNHEDLDRLLAAL